MENLHECACCGHEKALQGYEVCSSCGAMMDAVYHDRIPYYDLPLCVRLYLQKDNFDGPQLKHPQK